MTSAGRDTERKRMQRGGLEVFVTLVAVLLVPAGPVAAQAPRLMDLGPMTINYGAVVINNHGQVVLSTGIYANGVVTALPALPGATSAAVPVGINASGDVVGSALTSNRQIVAVLYSKGVLTNLGSPDGTAQQLPAGAVAINSTGQIAGFTTVGESPDETGVWTYSNGTVTAVPDSGCCQRFFPAAISDNGQIVGYADGGVNPSQGWIYDTSSQKTTVLFF